jgi:hypothetical protein
MKRSVYIHTYTHTYVCVCVCVCVCVYVYIYIYIYIYIYGMLEMVLEMISSNSQTCLTPGKQIIKYCLKFLSRKLPTLCGKFNGSCMTRILPVLPPRVGCTASYYSHNPVTKLMCATYLCSTVQRTFRLFKSMQ